MASRLFTLLAFVAVATPVLGDVCDMEDGDRLDCWDGQFSLNPEACFSRGCCWRTHDTPGIPWCYWRAGERPSVDEESCRAVVHRVDCSPAGRQMNEMMCMTAGCCFSESPGQPSCFFPYEGDEEEIAARAAEAAVSSSSSSASSGGEKRHQSLETAFSQAAGEGSGLREHTEGFGSGEHLLRQRVAAWRTPTISAARAEAALSNGVYVPPPSSPALPGGKDAPLSQVNAAWQGVAALGGSPRAPSTTTVLSGPARFTVLSDGLVRAEYSPHDPPRFHDSATLFAVNRAFPTPPNFTLTHSANGGGGVTITTPQFTLTYAGSGPFSPATLSLKVTSTGASWTPGTPPTASLHGTIRTLDRIGRTQSIVCNQAPHVNDTHCVEGPLSRDGWAVIDDSVNAHWEDTEGQTWPWVSGPAEDAPWVSGGGAGSQQCSAEAWDRYQCIFGNKVDRDLCQSLGCCFDGEAAAQANGHAQMWNYIPWCYHPVHPQADTGKAKKGGWGGSSGYTDLYLFARGRDYMGTIKDYRFLSGPIPQLPRYALGPMYSRWMGYHDFEEREIVATYERNNIPLDILIVDMDWHDSYPRGVPPPPSGARVPSEPWTGFTMWPALWPAPNELISELKTRGVRTVFNLHPHYGVQYFDAIYPAMAQALGVDPASAMPLQGDYTNISWADPFLRLAISPLESQGVDAWWVDWQQNEWSEVMGATSQIWSSYVFYSNPHRYGGGASPTLPPTFAADRPMVLNRWGGYGHHRYPFGFSGDADTNWEVLRYQVFLTATAANVGWSWSHDIGGFSGVPTPELMARWVQMGVFSPILRPHTAGKSGSHRDIWGFPFPAFEGMRVWFRFRAALVPYLAGEGRYAYDTGILPVHPTYYHYPSAPGAYGREALHAHTFGRDIYVAPILDPAPGWAAAAELAESRVWVPPGKWVEWGSWCVVEGGSGSGGKGLPKGMSVEVGEVQGGVYRERGWSVNEVPLYSPPGTILPLRTLQRGGTTSPLGTAGEAFTDLTLWVFPISPPGGVMLPGGEPIVSSRTLYEDDGQSVSYITEGEHTNTPITCTWRRVGEGGEEEAAAIAAAAAAAAADAAAAAAAAATTPTPTPTPTKKKGGILSSLFGLSDFDDDEDEEGGGGGGKSGGGGGAGGNAGAALNNGRVTYPASALAKEKAGTDVLTCVIGAREGKGYQGAPSATTWTWRFIATLPPSSVTMDGVPLWKDASAAPDAWGDGARWAPAPGASASISSDGSSVSTGATPGAWTYHGATLSTWVHSYGATPRDKPTTITLTWPKGVKAHTNPALTSGAPHMFTRAQAAKYQMNRAPFEGFVVDNPGLFRVLGTPARLEKAATTEAAQAELEALQGSMEAALNSVRTTMRNAQPALDQDVVVRMERYLQDGLTN